MNGLPSVWPFTMTVGVPPTPRPNPALVVAATKGTLPSASMQARASGEAPAAVASSVSASALNCVGGSLGSAAANTAWENSTNVSTPSWLTTQAAALAARAEAPAGVRVGLLSPRKARLYCLTRRSEPGCRAFAASGVPMPSSHRWQKGHW